MTSVMHHPAVALKDIQKVADLLTYAAKFLIEYPHQGETPYFYPHLRGDLFSVELGIITSDAECSSSAFDQQTRMELFCQQNYPHFTRSTSWVVPEDPEPILLQEALADGDPILIGQRTLPKDFEMEALITGGEVIITQGKPDPCRVRLSRKKGVQYRDAPKPPKLP